MDPRAEAGPLCVVAVVDGPVTAAVEARVLGERAGVGVVGVVGVVGAVLRFEGVVRRGEPCAAEGGLERDLKGLRYQTYDPMAEREFLSLARGVAERHGLTRVAAVHSRGVVAVGEVSFVLVVESVHRAEGIAGLTEFIDRMKRDVPIWKVPVWV